MERDDYVLVFLSELVMMSILKEGCGGGYRVFILYLVYFIFIWFLNFK